MQNNAGIVWTLVLLLIGILIVIFLIPTLTDVFEDSTTSPFTAQKYNEHHIVFSQAGDVDTVMDVEDLRFTARNDGTINDVFCSVDTAPTTTAVTIDVNLNGATIFTTQASRPSIAATNTEDLSDAPDVDTYVLDDVFQIEIDATDSGDTANFLVCQIRVKEQLFDTVS